MLVYDEAGHILGEYTATGVLVEETIWTGDMPVATLRPNGTTIDIYYVHTDHLGTPRKVTRPSDNALMWRWDPGTFGSPKPKENPDKLGAFNYNLRYPGQYELTESGLYYNYFRDYDPQTGRYIESDPIGLNGGSFSTYAYASNNPVMTTDRKGLQSIVPPEPPKPSASSPLPTIAGPLGAIPKFPDTSNPGKCTGECTEKALKGTQQCHRTCWALPGGAALCTGAWVERQEACLIHCATD